ncbi:MAG: hypothetical protein JWO02_1799 [Solirubrobacterales bacterium]|nr:hypothetical protein [Solirubrobacterales bacterium]
MDPDPDPVARAMALGDGERLTLARGGPSLYAGHRRVQDGARVALLTVPGVLRLDVHPQGDSLNLAVRNLSRHELPADTGGMSQGAHRTPDGRSLNEYRTRIALPGDLQVWLVIRVSPFAGELLRDHSAIAIVDGAV